MSPVRTMNPLTKGRKNGFEISNFNCYLDECESDQKLSPSSGMRSESHMIVVEGSENEQNEEDRIIDTLQLGTEKRIQNLTKCIMGSNLIGQSKTNENDDRLGLEVGISEEDSQSYVIPFDYQMPAYEEHKFDNFRESISNFDLLRDSISMGQMLDITPIQKSRGIEHTPLQVLDSANDLELDQNLLTLEPLTLRLDSSLGKPAENML